MRGITHSAIVNASGYWHNVSSLTNDIYRGLSLQVSDAGTVYEWLQSLWSFQLCSMILNSSLTPFFMHRLWIDDLHQTWWAVNRLQEQFTQEWKSVVFYSPSKPLWLSLLHTTKHNFYSMFLSVQQFCRHFCWLPNKPKVDHFCTMDQVMTEFPAGQSRFWW